MTWQRGATEVETFISVGELAIVEPSNAHARRLLTEARTAIRSAEMLQTDDPGSAFALAYSAARNAASALLAEQGLKPTHTGGHVVVQDTAKVQFNGPFKRFSRFRQRRNSQQYPDFDTPPVTPDDADEAIRFAHECHTAATRLLETGEITPWGS